MCVTARSKVHNQKGYGSDYRDGKLVTPSYVENIVQETEQSGNEQGKNGRKVNRQL